MWSFGFQLRLISLEMLKISITEICVNITHLILQSHLPGLTSYWSQFHKISLGVIPVDLMSPYKQRQMILASWPSWNKWSLDVTYNRFSWWQCMYRRWGIRVHLNLWYCACLWPSKVRCFDSFGQIDDNVWLPSSEVASNPHKQQNFGISIKRHSMCSYMYRW